MPMSPRLLRPVAAGGFNPRTIAGLEGWWDAADSGSVTLDGGRVAEWRDKSGKARHAANAASGSTQPDYITGGHNGRNLIRFAAASSQLLAVATASNWTFMSDGTQYYIAAVASFATTANPNAIYSLMGNHNGNGIGFLMAYDDRSATSSTNRLWFSVSNASAAVINPISSSYNNLAPAQQKNLLEVVADPSSATAAPRVALRSNGGTPVQANSATAAPSSSVPLQTLAFGAAINTANGVRQTFNQGDICEVLIYSGVVSAEARTAIRKYLANKWGITLA
jgi:hypothetical protein